MLNALKLERAAKKDKLKAIGNELNSPRDGLIEILCQLEKLGAKRAAGRLIKVLTDLDKLQSNLQQGTSQMCVSKDEHQIGSYRNGIYTPTEADFLITKIHGKHFAIKFRRPTNLIGGGFAKIKDGYSVNHETLEQLKSIYAWNCNF